MTPEPKELERALPETEADDVSIVGAAMLVALNVSSWAARRYDRKVSEEVNEERGASKDAGRYNKHLFADAAPSHAAIVKAGKTARDVHYIETLPWTDDGWRILPSANFFQYSAAIRKQQDIFDEKLEEFLAEYPALVEKAKADLNGLWRAEDYPSVDEIRRKFSFEVKYRPVPAENDFRVDLPEEQLAEMKRSVRSGVAEATEAATRDLWKRLFEIVQRIYDRLSADKVQVDVLEGRARGSIRDSLVESARRITDLLTRLNVANDPALEAMRRRIVDELTVFDSSVLRDDREVRDATAAKAAQILEDMAGIYGPVSG